MKKLFLLIPALAFALMANADVISITPTSPHSSNNLRQAINAANSGDIIEMAGGIYEESGDYLAFTDKEVTVRAAVGEEVIVKPHVCVRVKAPNAAAKAEFIGIKFDCSAMGDYSQLIVPADDKQNQRVILKDCEFYGWEKNSAMIHSTGSRRLDVIDIDNCYFHNCLKSVVFVENANLVSLSITNSTFANIPTETTSFSAAPIHVKATTGSVLVDHCTFYDVMPRSLSYGVITVDAISDVLVSNCIFARSSSEDMCTTNLPAGSNVKNCLTWYYDNWQPYGHYTTATVTDCMKADPLFKDAVNGDFSLYASSPARGAGLTGSDLGDPRWAKALTPIAIPATLVPFDALLSENASIIQSTPDSIFLKSEDNVEWAKWNITVAEDGLYDFKAYAKRTGSGSQHLEILVLSSDESVTLKSKLDESVPNEGTISTGAVSLVAGNTYIVKVRNTYNWAKSKLIKVEATYAGGKTIAIPDTLWPVDAIRSERAFVNDDGELRFTDDDHTGYIHDQWGKWNISVAEAGKYKFTANVNSANGQNYRITLKNSDESAIIDTWYGKNNDSGERKITTELVDLTIGNYVIMIEDTVNYSKGRVANIVASYEGGAVVNVPGQILAKYAVIKAETGKTSKMIHQANGDIEYKANASQLDEYAEWNLHATEAGEMEVSFNSPSEGHQFRFELYQSETLIGYVEESAASWTHNVTLTDHLTIPAVGDYTLKLINKQQYSLGVLHSVTFTPYVAPAAVTMSDTDTDNSAWVANVGGAACNVTLNRTILGGMFNAICLPFALTGSQVKAAFGNDVELYYLSDASIDNGVLNLEFGVANDIYQGTPYLIKTSSNVTNPTFNGVSIVLEEASSTFHTGWPVSFKGTFVSTTIAANGQNLLIYSDNQVGFPESDKTLKGFRAYFHLSSPSLAPSIQHARLITPNNAPMDIDFVESQESAKSQKLLRDGQLIILRDGVQYNVMGVKLQ